MSFQAVDIIIICVYFLLVFVIGFYFSATHKSLTDYFLAGRNLPWFIVGASMFTSNISSEHYIGLAGSGYDYGVAVGNFELSACILLIMLAWVFAPHYLKLGIFTTPEYIERRYNSACRWYLSVISIAAYIVTKISVTLLAGGIVLMQVMGWDLYTSCLVIVLTTGIYTVAGGTEGIARAQLFQMFVMIAGAAALTIIGLIKVGGIGGLIEKLPAEHFEIFKPADHPEFPWPGMVIGTLIIGFWYWNTDQFIVQRALTAKNTDEARRGILFTGFLKLLPVFILVMPGLIAHALYPDIASNQAYATLLFNILPSGFKGLVVAALLAALMSSLAACFNTSSTLFTFDIYKKLYPNANEFILVNVARIATIILVVFGIIWVPFINSISDHLFIYLQSVQAYLAPPIVVIFILGFFWRRATARAAFRVLIIGALLGLLKFILEIINRFNDGEIYLQFIAEMNFLYYSMMIFVICMILMIVLSYLDQAPDKEKTEPLIFKFKEASIVTSKRWKADVIGSIVLLCCVFLVWWILS